MGVNEINILIKDLKFLIDVIDERMMHNCTLDGTYLKRENKFIRDFRVKAVQNFLLNSATKPLRQNSAVGFMRPYDKAMQANLDGSNELLKADNKEGINYKDDLFFLDN